MSPQKPERTSKSLKVRSDGRRTLLVYMDSDLIKEAKKVALDDERPLYEIGEEATREWMGRRSSARQKSASKSASRGKEK
jgi:hypothetical protein